jgi:hypothetical protein
MPRIRSRLLCLALLAACRSEPSQVYVPAGEPQVELLVSASATEVAVGEPVILRAERRSRGEWKVVERSSLAAGQCWVSTPPPEREAEVADNLRWTAVPAAARFNTAYRTDRTREVVFLQAGTFTLESTADFWCSTVNTHGKPIAIRVHPPAAHQAEK